MLAIKSVDTEETLERWQFDIHGEDEAGPSAPSSTNANRAGTDVPTEGKTPAKKKREKTEKEMQGDIREIMKQITSSVTFLPILEDPCESSRSKRTEKRGTFTLLAYTDESGDVAIPATWGDADPHLIDRGQVEQVRLRSFNTNHHSLEVSRRRPPFVILTPRRWWRIE